MAGGGSHASGMVDYAKEIKDSWIDHESATGEYMRAVVDHPPDYVSGDDNSQIINPEYWYGTFGVTSTEALNAYKAVDSKALFTEFMAVSTDSVRVATLRSWLNALWAELGDAAGTEAVKNSMVSAFATRLATKINTDVIPSIDVGLRNTNAVLSSSIFMAKAAVWDGYSREVSDYSAKVDFEILSKKYGMFASLVNQEPQFLHAILQGYDLALRRTAVYLDQAKVSMATTLSLNDMWWTNFVKSRVIFVEDQIRTIKWQLDINDYMNKVMSSLSGAGVVQMSNISTAASVLSGAMAGAGAGAMVGGPYAPYTAAAGAIIGGVGGYLQSQR